MVEGKYMVDIIPREVEADTFVISLDGRWDAQSSPSVEEQVTDYVKSHCRLVLDLGGVSYMSSAALRTLLLLYREVKSCYDCHLVLAAASERLRDVMEITGFIDEFELYPTVENALRALRD